MFTSDGNKKQNWFLYHYIFALRNLVSAHFLAVDLFDEPDNLFSFWNYWNFPVVQGEKSKR
jgi:hypothetical protein